MDEKTKATLTNLETWKRGIFMIVFAIISGIAKLVVTLVAVFQFITLLFNGQPNVSLIPFGQNLSTYLYQITLFLVFKTDERPFPFSAFPDGSPQPNSNKGNEEDIATTEATTQNEEETVDATDENIKDDIESKKETKDDSFSG